MPPPKDESPPPPDPATPRRTPAAKHGAPTTPAARRTSAQPAGTTPKSAPAAGVAPASQRRKAEHTLLSDFLLGRQSPARVAAQRTPTHQRRKTVGLDAAGVREELRQEMRAAAVRKLQNPGKVHDRVKAWQKSNASAMKSQGGGVPDAEDVATEPTEFGEDIDDASVTERDRVRIKLRQKYKKKKADADKVEIHQGEGEQPPDDHDKDDDEEDEEGEAGVQKPPNVPRQKPAPKKRIVSDDNWMKRRKGRSPPRATPVKLKPKVEGSPTPIPKDFLQQTAQNPSVQNKIKDWAMRVEVPDEPQDKPRHRRAKSAGPATEEKEASTSKPVVDKVRLQPKTAKPPVPFDDGIRVRPMEPSEPLPAKAEESIRIKPIRKKEPPDDGIRIRPGRPASRDESSARETASRQPSHDRSTSISDGKHGTSRGKKDRTEEAREEGTPSPRRKRASTRNPKRSPSPTTVTQADTAEKTLDTRSRSDSRSSREDSELGSQEGSILPPTVLGNKSLKEIPFGYSAFSELDLPVGAEARNSTKRPKAQRTPSSGFKAVPNVLKKVVSGAKDIIQDKVDPPKPVVNRPPSIESWLNDTVDPFVENAPKRTSLEKQWAKERKRRSSSELRPKMGGEPASVPTTEPEHEEDQENADPHQDSGDRAATKETPKTAAAAGLKRSRATRISSSPLKFTGRKPFREALKEAFRGESGGHRLPAIVYPTSSKPNDTEDNQEEDEEDSLLEQQPRRRSSGSSKRSPSPDPSSTIESTTDSASTITGPPRRRPPPTKGSHELSTILSEEMSSLRSDTPSAVSQTTVTESTAWTKASEVSRKRSGKGSLKRRLTKHSDLVSVLSLPDNGHLVPPSRSKSIKSARRLHRRPSNLDKGGVEALLQEFEDDEHFYQRELRTLVDGVIPVLLTHVVHRDSRSTADFIAETAAGAPETGRSSDNMSRAVVNMGVSLEKLRSFHKRVPLSDIHNLLTWLDSVALVYDTYLDAWRLGFQDLIVNLAPASGKMEDEEDSLVNALPRNEEGDIVGENGERVDVAYLLKKPLIRLKWIVKFLKATSIITPSCAVQELQQRYEALQEKARKRHREENARVTDEDARNTDTTRTRELRTLSPLEDVTIDPSRQVAAKDSFSLELRHSNGQRLECQVELIHRDNPALPTDNGDVLIRDINNTSRSWLLFPPVPQDMISARKGVDDRSLIVMVRGFHQGKEWYELLKLSTDADDQIADWLDILGSNPLPPQDHIDAVTTNKVDSCSSPKPADVDIPVGERKVRKEQHPPTAAEPTMPGTPTRYRPRNGSSPSVPTTPTSSAAKISSPDRTPTQASYLRSPGRHALPSVPHGDQEKHPVQKPVDADPERHVNSPPAAAVAPFREDGAPPPPAHRTLPPKSPTLLAPPVDHGSSARVKRRTSSPLKHEWHPSDVSSEDDDSSDPATDASDDTGSSSDELDEDEVPDTVPGYSIRQQQKQKEPIPSESVVSESSLTPSNSASQGGLRHSSPIISAYPTQKFIASVSYWSNKKGQWKDIGGGQSSIVVLPGGVEVHHLTASHSNPKATPLQSSGASEVSPEETEAGAVVPLVALGLTPVVMIRQSNALDLEVRTKALPQSTLAAKIDSATYRFRAASATDAKALYSAVHEARLNNARYIALAEEARFRSFGEMGDQNGDGNGDGDSSSRRRHSWFGRRNSYRASTRAPSQSQGSSSSSISASGFLRRLTGGNTSFNIDKSTVDKHSGRSSSSGTPPTPASMYTSSASSSGGGNSTPPRSISVSLTGSGSGSASRMSAGFAKPFNQDKPLQIRLHQNTGNGSHWRDRGDCILQITRPPPGVRQELTLYHGLEKRVIVTHCSRKEGEKPLILLDAVLGSKSFSWLGTKGVMCSIWENLRDEEGNVGFAPKAGRISGHINKWCFQCASGEMAQHIMGMVTSEVPQVILD